MYLHLSISFFKFFILKFFILKFFIISVFICYILKFYYLCTPMQTTATIPGPV